MDTSVRLRLMFVGHILSKSQKLEGLKRSWLLLKPQHETISDVIFYILRFFDLQDSCPNGLIVSMDGFVLPPFESTQILKDKDLIRVKRKEAKLLDVIKGSDAATTLEEDEIVEKQTLTPGVQLLANEEFEKQAGAEPNEDANQVDAPGVISTTRKRKASNKLQGRKEKRKCKMSPGSVGISALKKDAEKSRHKGEHKKAKSSDRERAQNQVHAPEVDGSNTGITSVPNLEKHTKPCDSEMAVSLPQDGETRKVTRSTLRQRWRRKRRFQARLRRKMLVGQHLSHARLKKDELVKRQSPMKDINVDSVAKKSNPENRKSDFSNMSEHQQEGEDSDAEGEIVPIMIRPGHIRFAPKGKGIQQYQDVTETFQWNMNISKKKGQKWGMEKPSVQKRNEHRACNQDYFHSQATKRAKPVDHAESSVKIASGLMTKEAPKLNFEKLIPLTDLPKQGDIIAYRLLELASSWCPELSSFRVGKVAWFQPESNGIMLMPVPEYPFHVERKEDEDGLEHPLDDFHYSEDGSLEICLANLLDVRIVKRSDISSNSDVVDQALVPKKNPASVTTSKAIDASADSKLPDATRKSSEMDTTPGGNQKKDIWEEVTETLNAKKALLLQEDNWNKKENSGSRTWSRRTARSHGVGSTMAWIRGQDGV